VGRYASKAKNKFGGDSDEGNKKTTGISTFLSVSFLVGSLLFQTQIQSVFLLNFLFTLGGVMTYTQAVTGWWILLSLILVFVVEADGHSIVHGCLYLFAVVFIGFVMENAYPAISAEMDVALLAFVGLLGLFLFMIIIAHFVNGGGKHGRYA
jgi:hypothetical protein